MEEIRKEVTEKVILVAVADGDMREAEESLDELEELAKTAGAEVAARVIQGREAPHPGTYVGKGKIEEMEALLLEQMLQESSVMMNCPLPRSRIWSACWMLRSWIGRF